MIIIPVGLIRVFIAAFIRMLWFAFSGIGHFIGWCFSLLFTGSAVDRLFVVAVVGAAPAGFWGVRLARGGFHRAPRVAIAQPPPTAESAPSDDSATPSMFWSVRSADGAVTLSQTPSGGGCRFTCARGDQELWRAEGTCQGESTDRHFVAANCERSVVFYEHPTDRAHPTFIGVFERTRVAWNVQDRGLTRDPRALSGSHLIRGLAGNPGAAPTYTQDGEAVEFGVTDGSTQRVPLSF